MIEIQKILVQLVTQYPSFIIKDDKRSIAFNDVVGITEILDKADIEYRKDGMTELKMIEVSELPFELYDSIDKYLTISNIENINKKNALIFGKEKIISIKSGGVYIDFVKVESYLPILNAINFVEYLMFIQGLETGNNSFHFVDYVNEVDKKMLFTTAGNNERLVIKWGKKIPIFDERNCVHRLEDFKKCFEEQKNVLPKFLKSVFIKYASKEDDENKRLFYTYQQLSNIVNEAKVNYDVYLNDLSIDDVLEKYNSYKSKYLLETSEQLKKIIQSIASFPVITAGTLFAFEKVKENHLSLTILAFLTVTSTALFFLLIKLIKGDLQNADDDSKASFENLIKNNFFKKNKNQIDRFEIVRDRISAKVKYLNLISKIYIYILFVVNSAILIIIVREILDFDFEGVFTTIFVGCLSFLFYLFTEFLFFIIKKYLG